MKLNHETSRRKARRGCAIRKAVPINSKGTQTRIIGTGTIAHEIMSLAFRHPCSILLEQTSESACPTAEVAGALGHRRRDISKPVELSTPKAGPDTPSPTLRS